MRHPPRVIAASGGWCGNTIFSPRTGGREDAERLYDDAWKASIRERYGVEPSIEYFESPVIVDNDAGAISVAA